MSSLKNKDVVVRTTTTRPSSISFLAATRKDDGEEEEEEEEIFIPTSRRNDDSNDNSNNNNVNNNNNVDDNDPSPNFMDDLTPPPVNFARNSILFSKDPATKRRNNSALEAWTFTRTYLPAFITGAWPWRDIPSLDERPLAALYNAAFVRLPVVAVAVAYLYQKIIQGHDLVVDFGFDPMGGPQAVNPVLVLTVLILILL